MSHYASIYMAYAFALLTWLAIGRMRPQLWPKSEPYKFDHPWHETAYVLVALVFVIAIGQAYVRGIRLPEDGPFGSTFGALNQIVIFSPVVILLFVRRHPPETAWLRIDQFPWRIGAGLVIALPTILVYTLVRDGADAWWTIVTRVYQIKEFDFAVQVFLEDFVIAMLAVRLSAAVGAKTTVVIVASLFAAGHIPTMIYNGLNFTEMGSLIADAVLGCALIGAALRSRDLWWLWLVHYPMDMMQFERISGIAS